MVRGERVSSISILIVFRSEACCTLKQAVVTWRLQFVLSHTNLTCPSTRLIRSIKQSRTGITTLSPVLLRVSCLLVKRHRFAHSRWHGEATFLNRPKCSAVPQCDASLWTYQKRQTLNNLVVPTGYLACGETQRIPRFYGQLSGSLVHVRCAIVSWNCSWWMRSNGTNSPRR